MGSKSKNHARSVHLILNSHIGLLSPQCHIEFDDTFKFTNNIAVPSKLQEKCHFVVNKNDKTTIHHKCEQSTNLIERSEDKR
jgi:hypothetical protein